VDFRQSWDGQRDIAQHVGLEAKVERGAGQIMVPHEVADGFDADIASQKTHRERMTERIR
jgi:hypothetical protein